MAERVGTHVPVPPRVSRHFHESPVFAGGLVCTAAALGIAIPYASGELAFALFAAVAVPALVWLTFSRPAVALGVYIGAQVFEAFERQTPVGTISLGVVMLALMLFAHHRQFVAQVRDNRTTRVVTWLLGGGLWLYLLRGTYTPVPELARDLTTQASFLAVGALGVIAVRWHNSVRNAAVGATAALLFLGICGVAAALGYIPLPDRVGVPRTIFGFQSPLERNYGLNVPFDAVALLVPLSVPLLVLNAAFGSRFRLLAGIVLIAELLLILLVFQARGMVLQVLLAVALALWFARPRAFVVVALCCVPLLFGLMQEITETDEISSGLRTATSARVWDDVVHRPHVFLLGQDEVTYVDGATSERSPDLAFAQRNFERVKVHNIFLSRLVGGGWLAFILLLVAYGVVVKRAWEIWNANQQGMTERMLLSSIVLVLVALMVEPVTANIVGCWLLIGFVAGFVPGDET